MFFCGILNQGSLTLRLFGWDDRNYGVSRLKVSGIKINSEKTYTFISEKKYVE